MAAPAFCLVFDPTHKTNAMLAIKCAHALFLSPIKH